MDYRKLWEEYKNYNEYDHSEFQYIEDDFHNAIFSAYKIQSGKKTKDFNKAWKFLGEDTCNKIREPFSDLVKVEYEKRKIVKQDMENILKEYAKTYEIPASDDMICILTRDSSDYHTQGYGAAKYAKSALTEHELLLNFYGYKTEIREIPYSFEASFNREKIYSSKYELWANITEFDYWMFKHSGKFISVLNWAVLCWRNGTNPKIYFPFLSNLDYEKSLKLYRDYNYVITKENCMLEPD